MKGAIVKLAILNFFLDMVYIFTIPKISLRWGPLQPFLNIDHDFGHICFLKKWWNFFGTKSGSYSGQKIISFSFGVFFDWEISIYFCPLFVHLGTLWNTLTYSGNVHCCHHHFILLKWKKLYKKAEVWLMLKSREEEPAWICNNLKTIRQL